MPLAEGLVFKNVNFGIYLMSKIGLLSYSDWACGNADGIFKVGMKKC